MNPSFNFVFGKPLNDGEGRWVEGSIQEEGAGYTFEANLMRRLSAESFQCHWVRLQCDRPFRAQDFAAYLLLVARGKFETASRVLDIDETSKLDPEVASAILKATAVWINPWDHECMPLLQNLASLGEQLEQVLQREQLGVAFARIHRIS